MVTQRDEGMKSEHERARTFLTRLQSELDVELVSGVLYGSAARGEYRPGSSDLNLLVLLADLGPRQLRAAAGPTRNWMEQGNPPPLLMSAAEWRSSADVFPIEYSDIRDAHVLLTGQNPFDGIRIDRRHLRLQLEHELRSKKIQLREGFVAAGESPEGVGAILVTSISTFLALFRGLLRLAGDAVPGPAAEVIRATAARVGFPAEAVLEVQRLKQEAGGQAPRADLATADAYLGAVEDAARWLDRYRPPEDAPPEV